MKLNRYGKIVESEFLKTQRCRLNVKVDEYVVMPNHFHGIITIIETVDVGATRRVAPTKTTTIRPNTIGSIIGQIKSASTKKIRIGGMKSFRWQRNYWEHVIRNEEKLYKIRQYIQNNPLKWHLDRENPEREGTNKLEEEIFKFKRARGPRPYIRS
jgi:REP element-mobilizing transposase RayT